jgi:hypothetical protein
LAGAAASALAIAAAAAPAVRKRFSMGFLHEMQCRRVRRGGT